MINKSHSLLIGGAIIVVGVIAISLLLQKGEEQLPASSQNATSTENKSGAQVSTKTPPKVPLSPGVEGFRVIYSSSGFSPQVLVVEAGDSVSFVNQSNTPLWVMAPTDNESLRYLDFNQGRSVGKGGTYDFTFNNRGVWVYFNLNDKSKTGVVQVK